AAQVVRPGNVDNDVRGVACAGEFQVGEEVGAAGENLHGRAMLRQQRNRLAGVLRGVEIECSHSVAVLGCGNLKLYPDIWAKRARVGQIWARSESESGDDPTHICTADGVSRGVT